MKRYLKYSLGIVVSFCLALASCGGSDSPSSPGTSTSTPSTITLSASSLSFASLGETQALTAMVRDHNGEVITTSTVSWSSTNAQIASVSSGVVTSVGNGSATITATAGSVSATAEVMVQQVPVWIDFAESIVTIGTADNPLTLQATGEDANGYSAPVGSIVWNSSDPNVATVDTSGTVAAVSAGWTLVNATTGELTGNVTIHVVSPGFPTAAPAYRALHLGGNWLGNELHAGVPHQDFLDFIESLDVNWVGVSVALHYGESTDPTVRRVYEGVGTKTFTDDVLRTLIREFRQRGVNVYVTLAFEPDLVPGSGQPDRWLLGQPWLEGGFQADEWPWLPTHPDHEEFVSQFWSSYTEQAVHFARIAEEEGAGMFSLGTETDRLFRTRTEGPWVTEFGDEIRAMVQDVRNVFSGLVTYDQVYSVLIDTDFWGTAPTKLWEDGGFDVIGLSAYFRLVPTAPTHVMSVGELEDAWEDVLIDILQPIYQANHGRPIMFIEFGYVDDIRAPADPTIEEFEEKVFLDTNGNGLDDGEEVQANICEALYRALETHPIVQAVFFWDHAMDADAEIEALSHLRSTRVRKKLAEEVVRQIYLRQEWVLL